jgi:hypothetical protein
MAAMLKIMSRSAAQLSCISLLVLVNCRFSNELTLRGDSRVRVRVLYDTADVRTIAEQGAQIERNLREYGRTMDDFINGYPGKAFAKLREEMDKQPGFEVPGGTSFRILFEVGNLYYTKVQFTTGTFKSQVAWVPKQSFDDPRSEMP